MEGFVGNKRSRDDWEELPEAKRLHADLLFDILEVDDLDTQYRDSGSQDLATVIKILEEEIALPPENGVAGHVEIGYLLEATDDDLGLPPASQSVQEVLWTAEDIEPAEGFGQIWGFEEETPLWYEGLLEFGAPPEEKFGTAEESGSGVVSTVDGGLFDSSEFYWRPESLSAQ